MKSDKQFLWKTKVKIALWTVLKATSMKCKVFWVAVTTIVPLDKENYLFSCEAN